MVTQLPALIVALSLTVYWGSVIAKLVLLSKKIGKDPNAIPREKLGKWLRFIWYPIVIAWIGQAWTAGFHIESHATYVTWLFLGYMGAIITITATALTFVCWHKMGTSWRIGIDPSEVTELIVTGPYRYVLHPIYSLSMLLAVATLLAIPTLLMLITIVIHCGLLYYEAIREEHYLTLQHGQRYIAYKKTVGKFVPKTICIQQK